MRRGFTLIEVVVTMGVFSIASLLAVNLFVFFVQQQRRTVSQQELQSDARVVMEDIADQLREGVVDYDYYEVNNPMSTPSNRTKLFSALDGTAKDCLVILDAVNQQVRYRLQGTVVQKLILNPATTTACDDAAYSTLWQNITPDNLTIGSFTFAVAPSEDPYAKQTPQTCSQDDQCRWGTTCCKTGTTCNTVATQQNCQFLKGNACYCTPQLFSYDVNSIGVGNFPFHPRVTFSMRTSRVAGQQTVSQTFQTTIASRQFKNAEKFNRYAN